MQSCCLLVAIISIVNWRGQSIEQTFMHFIKGVLYYVWLNGPVVLDSCQCIFTTTDRRTARRQTTRDPKISFELSAQMSHKLTHESPLLSLAVRPVHRTLSLRPMDRCSTSWKQYFRFWKLSIETSTFLTKLPTEMKSMRRTT